MSSTTSTTTTTPLTTTTTTTTTTATTTTTTPTPCGPGEYLSLSNWRAATCNPCRHNTFLANPYPHFITECAPLQKCSGGEFAVSEGNATHNYICRSHTECGDGEFESKKPGYAGGSDRECTPITPCAPGQYIRTAATTTRDQVCRRCDGSTASFTDGLC